jgi:hypothetical protein
LLVALTTASETIGTEASGASFVADELAATVFYRLPFLNRASQ